MKFSDLGDKGAQFKLDELTGWTQPAQRPVTQPKRPSGQQSNKSPDKRSTLQRQKDAGKKNWFEDEQDVAEGDLDEASLAQMRDYFGKDNADSVQVNRNYDTPSMKKNPAGIPPEIQTLVNKMYHAGKITPQEFEVLRKFQRQTKINVGIREADANPYAIGMSQAMKSTGDKPPLKKSTINKAHAIARAIEKDE